MNTSDVKERVLAAQNLLTSDSITRETFESVRTLLKGINPQIDKTLASCSKALDAYGKLEKGELIELSVENLPENTEEEKERKRKLLLFIRSYKDLRSEVERVKSELTRSQEGEPPRTEQIQSFGRIVTGAKGPFGIITIVAVVIVGAFVVFNTNTKSTTESSVKGESVEVAPSKKTTIQVIEFQGKKIALSELVAGKGSECDNDEHYHAKDHTAAKALDGTIVSDPGGCGFGKVKDVRVLEVEQ